MATMCAKRRRTPTGQQLDPALLRHDLLTAEEEHALAVRAAAGDKAARDELVLKNQRLVLTVARAYRGGFHSMPDLVSAGNCGLMRAVKLFDPSRGHRFTTYAMHWVRSTIAREVIDHGYTVRVPAWASGLVRRYEKAERRLASAGDGPPSFADVCREAGVPDAHRPHLARGLRAREATRDLPESDAEQFASADDDPAAAAGSEEAVAAALADLPPREERAVRLYFGLAGGPPLTYRAIGRQLGCSRSAAKNLADAGLGRLRESSLMP